MDSAAVGARVRALIEARTVAPRNYRELAEAMGVKYPTLKVVLSGHKPLRTGRVTLARLAMALEVAESALTEDPAGE